MDVSQILGLLGTVLVAAAYVPQIHHLLKEHCSAGISIRAYALWFLASALFLTHATMIMDVVFIGVQLINLVAICIIVCYAKRYERQICESHLHELVVGTREQTPEAAEFFGRPGAVVTLEVPSAAVEATQRLGLVGQPEPRPDETFHEPR